MRKSTSRPLADRFWEKVDKSGECWEWIAYRAPDGYGRIGVGPKPQKRSLAHRVSWELSRGPIPQGKLIDHICHNRGCVNLDHLRVVNDKQNAENLAGAHRDNRTGVRGVTWDPVNKKFRVLITHNYRAIHVGRFSSLEEAKEASIAKRLELFTHSDSEAA